LENCFGEGEKVNIFSSLWNAGGAFILRILEFFQNVTGSYGVAIILLTVAVRLMLYPLSHKQMLSMTQMQKIQPRIARLREKYADDKETLQREMIRLYKENNVNPFAGCLPILVQLPVMILLFRALMNYEVADAVFIGVRLDKSIMYGLGEALGVLPEGGLPPGYGAVLGGIFSNPAGLSQISLYLPALILMVVICVMTWAQQKLSGAGNNPEMATMNVIMPFFMGFICLTLPGGVLVYWGTSSLIGILQQWFVMRKTKELMEVKPALYKNKPIPGRPAESLEAGAKNLPEEDEDEYEDDDDYYDDDEYEDGEEYDDEDEYDDRGGVK
jgi:YidC/Oxa1 family membrane protein insertase